MASETISQERLNKALTHLTTHKTLITNCIDQWTTITTHFTNLDESITSKSKTLDTKLETLDTDLKQTLNSLDEREKSIPSQEPLLIARINELKDSALTECDKKLVTDALEEVVKGYFRKMDAAGLLKYISVRRKDGERLRCFLPEAVKEAVDQDRFVLDCVKEFMVRKETKTGFAESRQALTVLLMEVFPVKERRLPVAKSLREEAGDVAHEWKGVIEKEHGDKSNGHVDGGNFLNFVRAFGVYERFEKGFLRKLIVERPTQKYVAKIVSKLGFVDDEIGEIIDDLLKRDKEIDAINFACECGLTERFKPVELLDAYLNKAKERAQKVVKEGNSTSSARSTGNVIELNALRVIIKCVEEHKLEEEFPLKGIKERAAVLEKSKPERRAGFNKRARGSGADSSYPSYPTKYGKGPSSYAYDRRNPAPAYQSSAAAYAGSYRNHPGAYSSHYGAHSRIPSALAPPESLGAAAYDYSGVAPSTY